MEANLACNNVIQVINMYLQDIYMYMYRICINVKITSPVSPVRLFMLWVPNLRIQILKT